MSRSSTSDRASRLPRRVPDFLVVGKVTRPHGVAGEVRIMPMDTTVDRLLELPWAYFSPGEGRERRRLAIRRARPDRGGVLMLLEGIESREAAGELRQWLVEIPGSWIKPLPEGRYYVFELVGCRVETVAGEGLGTVVEVLPTGANDVYVVEDETGRQVLIPAIRAMVKEIDVDEQRIVVDPWPGLIDEG